MPYSAGAVAQLKHFANFEMLSDRDRFWISSTAQLQDCQAGHVLIQEGQASNALYILMDGKLEVIVSRQDGGEEQLKTLFAGEMMGEMSFLDNHLPAATIRVLEASQVFSLSKTELAHKLEQDGDFAARFYQVLAIKLSRQIRALTDLITTNRAVEDEPLPKILLAFAALNDSDIAWMIAHSIPEKVAPQTVLIQQGQPVPAIYLLLEGTLGIYLSNGQIEIEVAKSVKGEMLGEMSFVETGVASATVKATEEAWVLGIPQAKLAAKLQGDRRFASRFYRAIALILANRWRDRLVKRGFATLAHTQTQPDSDFIESIAIAGSRFDCLIRQLRA